MKIIFVSPSISRLYTGVYDVEKNLALEFMKKHFKVEVHGMYDEFTNQDLPNWLPIEPVIYMPYGPKKIGFNPFFLINLIKSKADVGHIHALWSFTAFALFLWSKINRKPYVLSVNAYLFKSALNQSRMIKNVALFVGIKKTIKSASCIHVNTENEYRAVRDLGYTNPITIIPNGVRLPDLSIEFGRAPWNSYIKTKDKRILLYLSRVHPQKGVDLLVNAWKELSDSGLLQNWHLVIVGLKNDNSRFENSILDLVEFNNLHESITLLPGQFDKYMNNCYSNCDAYVLPSFNEGTSIAALNALAFSKPTLITRGCNISKIFENDCAIEIEPLTESIKIGIITLINMNDEDRKVLGSKGREFVEMNYSWETVSSKILEVYLWLKGHEVTCVPNSVCID